MPTVHYNDQDILEVDADWLRRLKADAAAAPMRRARLCLHHGDGDRVHEMLIVFCRGSLIRPHRHHGRSESFHIVEGELQVVVFDAAGTVTRVVDMGPPGSGKTFMYRLTNNYWHTVVPTSEFAVVHETTEGPFDPSRANYAPWSPEDEGALRQFVEQSLASFDAS